MTAKPKAETARITSIHTNADWRYTGFCPFCGEGIKAFQYQRQLSPVQQHIEVRAQGPSSQNQRPPLQPPRGDFKREVKQTDVPYYTIFRSGPQEPRTQILLILGLGAKTSRLLPGRLFLMSLTAPYGTLLLCKCILDARLFLRYSPFPVPKTWKKWPIRLGNQNGNELTRLHISSVSSDSFEKHPTSCIWLTSGLRTP